ncbi:MAG: hypothetical protein A3F13_02580 [Gammaproteobacteria bacterium RIFCSPHIGHO2_12_FULL_40_19]|nr:MAG: hypothetical protein A3F13_02580 [Gammaproteobacteria bacterium RIFCSPHIGHO2_12_FULL_40_19]
MAVINNSINNKIGGSNSGATNTLTVDNASNSASSSALLNITVGGTSADDAYQTFTVSGVTTWAQGIDNSVTGDPYVLAASSALGTTNVVSASTAGVINYPLQPAFFVIRSTALVDVVGDSATPYLIIYDSELFDQGSDYNNATGVFTAPVTGRYQFAASPRIGNDLTAAMTYGETQLVASNRTLIGEQLNIGATRTADADTPNQNTLSIFALIDMDAADTISNKVIVNGGAGATANILGATSSMSYFSGFLAC